MVPNNTCKRSLQVTADSDVSWKSDFWCETPIPELLCVCVRLQQGTVRLGSSLLQGLLHAAKMGALGQMGRMIRVDAYHVVKAIKFCLVNGFQAMSAFVMVLGSNDLYVIVCRQSVHSCRVHSCRAPLALSFSNSSARELLSIQSFKKFAARARARMALKN